MTILGALGNGCPVVSQATPWGRMGPIGPNLPWVVLADVGAVVLSDPPLAVQRALGAPGRLLGQDLVARSCANRCSREPSPLWRPLGPRGLGKLDAYEGNLIFRAPEIL